MSESATIIRASERVSFVFLLPFVGYGIFLCESIFARPNPLWAFALLLWSVGATLLVFKISRKNAENLWNTIDRYASHLVIGLIILIAILFITINIFQTYYFAPGRDAEDTAYYGQILWNTFQGNILSGNVLQERLFNPPVSSDLALHVSPILLAFLPIYLLLPDTLTLLIIRDIALACAAWPLFLLARERMEGTAGVAAAMLYLVNPVSIAQVFDAFHLLQLAPLPFFYALRAFVREELGIFLSWTAIALSLREDVGIALTGFGLWAFVIRRPSRWWILGLGIPVVWWGISTLLIQPAFGRWGNQVAEIAFAGGSHASLGVYQILLGNPTWIADILAAGGLLWLYRLLRVTAFLSIFGKEGLLAIPSLAANLCLARMLPDASDPISRFAILPVCALIGAAVLIVDRMRKVSSYDIRAYTFILLVLLPSVSLFDGVKDAVEQRLTASLVRNDASTLWEAVRLIPDSASVAAPKYVLPALANRQRLYFLQNFSEYPPRAQVDYYLIDKNLERFDRNLGRRAHYVALMEKISSSLDYKLVWQKGEYALYQRKLSAKGGQPNDG